MQRDHPRTEVMHIHVPEPGSLHHRLEFGFLDPDVETDMVWQRMR